MQLNFKNTNFIFFIFICLVLSEGIIHHFYYIISYKINFLIYEDQKGYNPIIWHENGLIENLQVIFILLTIIFFILFFKKNYLRLSNFFRIIFFTYLICLFYYFFEETSWGQHIFKWETTTFFLENNKQNETNLHNISNVFNQLPRNILLLWCTIPCLIKGLKLIQIDNTLNIFIFPSRNLTNISIVIILITIPQLIENIFDLSTLENNILYDLITFKFIRFSEFQELLFNYYILIHAYYLNKKCDKLYKFK